MSSIEELRKSTLGFIEKQRIKDQGIGKYRYSSAVSTATLYSSCYAVMTRSLYNDFNSLTGNEREEWVDYFNNYQDDDGLFRDPVIFHQGWYRGDPLWCGRPHLTCHVVTALACLDAAALKPLRYLEPYKDSDFLVIWLKERDWGERVGWTGNEIMNIGILLQYARDFQDDLKAGKAVEVMLEWLSTNYINPDTGVWGSLDVNNPINRSHAVQAAYHWWLLFFYDNYPIPYMKRAINTLLETQNCAGGFGWGVHNPIDPFNSSACEDIDSIDPLVRMMQVTDYRKDEVCSVLDRAASRVLKNQMRDGGFAFMMDCPFEYGCKELYSDTNMGAMFPTWFRTLSLALIGKALPEHTIGKYYWNFVRCPGYQFR